MSELTTDRKNPGLNVPGTNGQNEVYLVLSEEERAKGYIRPVRSAYIHNNCGTETTMGLALAETYAREPSFYGATFCCGCCNHFPVSEFVWSSDGSVVGS